MIDIGRVKREKVHLLRSLFVVPRRVMGVE